MLSAKSLLKVSKFPTKGFKGKRVIGEDLDFVYNTKVDGLKLVVSVSKKVAPKAVDRNRIKRTVKESLKSNSRLKGELLIIVKKNLASFKTPEIRVKLEKIIKKL